MVAGNTMVETMTDRTGHPDQPGLHQDGGMTVRTGVQETTVELTGMTGRRKSGETGERKGRKTLYQGPPERDHGHLADAHGPQQEDHVLEPDLLQEEGQEQVLDTMCRCPRFLSTFPPVM